MIKPATRPLVGNRRTPFVYAIAFPGLDLTGAVLDMHVRSSFDAPGDPLIDLSPAALGSQGLALTVAAGPTSTITIRIDKATMEALPFPAVRGDDAVLVYDLHMIPPGGGDRMVYFRGTFTVRAGSTIPA